MPTNTSLRQAVKDIADAIRAKGVTGTMSLSEMPTKVAAVPTGYTKYGLNMDSFLGDVNGSGALQQVSGTFSFSSTDIRSIPDYGLYYAFYGNTGITSINLPNLTSIGQYGMQYAFQGCTSLTSIDLSGLTTVGNYGLAYSFKDISSLSSIDLSSLTTIGQYGLRSAFENCSSLTNLDLSSLTSVDRSGLTYAFAGCSGLTTVDMSNLTSVGQSGMESAFRSCTSLRTVLLKKLSSATSAFYGTFMYCTNLEVVDFSEATAVPPLNNINAFQSTNNTYRIIVPNALYNQWIAAANWSDPSIKPHIEKAIKGLAFKAGSANSTVKLMAVGSPSALDLEYSTDGGTTFAPYTVGTTITLTNVGDTMLLRAGANGNTAFATDGMNYHKFVMTGSIGVEDSIVWLLDRQGTMPQTLADHAFYGLFENCSSLTTAPELPFTSLGDYCYAGMFNDCTGLTTPPELPATTLADSCYEGMFNGCSGLTTTPDLDSTTLANSCYSGMFSGCSSLTTAPTLPATTLVSGCYNAMFYNCSSLNEIRIGYTGNFSTTYFNNWVFGVAASGTFYYQGSDTTVGTSAIPSGWTVPTVVYKNYINTNRAEMNINHVPTTSTRITGRFRGDAVGNYFIGTGNSWRFFNAGDNKFYFDVSGGRINQGTWDKTKWYDVDVGNYYFTCVPVDGGTTLSQTSTARSFTYTDKLKLGSSTYSWGGVWEEFDCAGFKIYEGNTLVKDFRPVLDPNSVACFYEELSGTYYYPSTGTFLAY